VIEIVLAVGHRKLEKHCSDPFFPLSPFLSAIFFLLGPSYFHFNCEYFQLALINDLAFQRKNTPPHLSRKFDELKTVFGFQKKSLAKCSALHF